MEIATPCYSHVKNYENVYEPSEDTFLLLDALQAEQKYIKDLRPLFVLEIGCGSGLVTSFVSKIVGRKATYLCTDKNMNALECCTETARRNRFSVECILTDLVGGLLPRLEEQVDVLLFNPPYVVTPSEEVGKNGLSSAWAGGKDGREVMDQLFPLISHILSKKGVFYLVVIKENKPDDIMKLFAKMEFQSSIILSRRTGPEFLSVIRFNR